MSEHVIEFRSGTYFQDLEPARGGSLETARTFPSKKAAEDFMDVHYWILLNGGMAVPVSAR